MFALLSLVLVLRVGVGLTCFFCIHCDEGTVDMDSVSVEVVELESAWFLAASAASYVKESQGQGKLMRKEPEGQMKVNAIDLNKDNLGT